MAERKYWIHHVCGHYVSDGDGVNKQEMFKVVFAKMRKSGKTWQPIRTEAERFAVVVPCNI